MAVVKEWADAGMIFELTGAKASQAAAGGDVRHILVPLALAVLAAASWALRPESRKPPRAAWGWNRVVVLTKSGHDPTR
jgi:hypothetical protein